ncbi:MAG TPA: hypothetical protein VGB98_10805 [Pyrinomonadaceae bacterium]|jgi:hypothetical protein
MTACTVSDNFTGGGGVYPAARPGGLGGGVGNTGVLTKTDCNVSNNRTGDGAAATAGASLTARQ